MKIRKANSSDLPAIAACAELAFGAAILRTDPTSDGDLASRILEGSIYVIGLNNSVLGYIALLPLADHVFVDTVAVLPKHHSEGLGSQLLSFAESEALRLDLRSVRLFTMADMSGNLVFYSRRGYRETGRCDDDGFPRIFYTKYVVDRCDSKSSTAIT